MYPTAIALLVRLLEYHLIKPNVLYRQEAQEFVLENSLMTWSKCRKVDCVACHVHGSGRAAYRFVKKGTTEPGADSDGLAVEVPELLYDFSHLNDVLRLRLVRGVVYPAILCR